MAIDWNEYDLVLEEESSKECEVTGRDMGGTDTFICPVKDLIENNSPRWTPQGNYDSYGGYQSYSFTFHKVDDEAVYLSTDKHYHEDIVLKPGDKWSSGWYGFGSWDYCVRLMLRKRE